MKMAQTWSCKLETPEQFMSVALFKGVTNAADIKKRVMAGEFELSLLKPAMIIDKFQLQIAATKALHQQQYSKMQTRNLHSELLYCLTATKNISDAFRKFGLEDKDQSVLIVEVHTEGNSKLPDLQKLVQGQQVSLDTLSDFTQEALIKKVYKIKEEELQVGSLLEGVISRMASKDFVSFS